MRSALGTFLLLAAALSAGGAPNGPELREAAARFVVQPTAGGPAAFSATGQTIGQVIGDLRSVVTLIEYASDRVCLVTSPFWINDGDLQDAVRQQVARDLSLPPEAVICACAHDHTLPQIDVRHPDALFRKFMAGLSEATRGLPAALRPVTVEWGTAQENRVTYNRRGRRPNGKSYFIREEDRAKLGSDYVGTIDPDASILVFRGRDGKPVSALAFFTGHPVTGYDPEHPVSFGQWPQVACEKLSGYLGGVPVGFLQGCAGDINSKGMLTGTIAQSIELGGFLGESYIRAAQSLHRSRRTDFEWRRLPVGIPLQPLPDIPSLERDLASIDDFVRRGRAGDPDTLDCVGMNFPLALSPLYRANLVLMVRPWYVWALKERRSGAAEALPRTLPLHIVVARIGDVGLVGMPFEAFVRTGFKIKRETPLACVLPACYIDGMQGYIPDATSCDDREYQAGYFRYLGNRAPYRSPGGDAAASVAVAALRQMAE